MEPTPKIDPIGAPARIEAFQGRELQNFDLVHEFDPLDERHMNDDITIRLMLRVIENRRGKRFLDLREYQLGKDAKSGEPYEGYTTRGVRIGVHETDRLKSLLTHALEIMRKRERR